MKNNVWKAVITRQEVNKVCKDEIKVEELSQLLSMIEIYDATDILEINIIRCRD